MDIPAETLTELRDGLEIAQAALAEAVTSLGGLIPEPGPKRITISVSQDTHTRIKLDCVARHVNMADAVRDVVERAWPPGRREAA
jgi:hypothetical protein